MTSYTPVYISANPHKACCLDFTLYGTFSLPKCLSTSVLFDLELVHSYVCLFFFGKILLLSCFLLNERTIALNMQILS